MSWIENIRNKPHAQKVRIIWAMSLLAFVVLVAVWIMTTRIGKNSEKDTTLFQTIGRGIKDIRDNFRKDK